MWFDYIENSKAIESVYEGCVPKLENVDIYDVNIFFGAEVELQLTLKMSHLPKEMPRKWKCMGVNKVELTFSFLDVHFGAINDICESLRNASVEITVNADGQKRVQIFDNECKLLIDYTTRWIYLFKLAGITESKDLFLN